MNFVFTDEQRLFQRTVRAFFDKECTPEYVRAAGPADHPTELWRGLASLGVTGLTIPEESGGLGKDETDLVLLLEEAGRAALPEPLMETTAVAAPMLSDVESLSQIAAGAATATVRPGRIIVNGDHGVTAIEAPDEALLERGAFGSAAVLCGIADRVIELAAAYAKERHQFGRPIGSFQAVKHLLADALLGLEFARPAVYRAAWSIARGDVSRGRDVSMAKALASDAAIVACRSSLQVHGAIGYTHEHDLHLWLNKGFALAHAWGTSAWHRERVASEVLGDR
jgi:alkylation response protein AidB-like acyl-CoA dehydrogenase